MNRLKTLLLSAVFLFMLGGFVAAPEAIASGPSVDQLPSDGSAPFKLADKDYFVGKLLRGFLGDVVDPNGDSATSSVTGAGNLGEIFRTFNLGVAFFGTLLVMFIAMVGVLQSGQDGEFLGRKWSSMWVPVRFCIGSALMLPLTSSGYSFVQAMVLYIAMQGIGFADTVWSTIVKQMVMGTNSAQVWGIIPSEKLSRNMMNSAICAAAINRYTKDNPVPFNVGFTASESTSFTGQKTKTWRWGDASYGVDHPMASVCGTFTYTYSITDFATEYGRARIAVIDEHAKQIGNMASVMGPTGAGGYGIKLLNALESTEAPATAKRNLDLVADSINKEVMTQSAAYSKAVAAAADKAVGNKNAASRDSKIQELTTYGFATAGAYYIELTRMQSAVNAGMSSVPTYSTPRHGDLQSAMPSENFTLVMSYFDQVSSGVSSAADSARLTQAESVKSGSANVVDITSIMPDKAEFLGSPEAVIHRTSTRAANQILWMLVGVGKSNVGMEMFDHDKEASLSDQLHSNMTGSAVLELKNRGDNILNAAVAIYVAKEVLVSTIYGSHEAVKGNIASSNLGGPFVSGFAYRLMEGFSKVLSAALSAFFAFGFMLAVYVPMVPYMLWTGGLVGMLVLIAEALVASSLWAVMIIHPSGEGLTSDHSQRGVMMLLVLFARAALMTMGMVMGIYMVDPLVTMVNDTFFLAMGVLQKGTSFTGLFSMVGFGVIYTSLILSVVNRSFAMIHTVPDKVLEWIGGHGARLGESHAREDARGMLTTASGMVGGGAAGGMLAMGGRTQPPPPDGGDAPGRGTPKLDNSVPT